MISAGELLQKNVDEIIGRNNALLKQLQDSKILIIGSTGFIGTWITSTLIRANEQLALNMNFILISRNKFKAINRFNLMTRTNIEVLEFDMSKSNEIKLPKSFIPTHMIFAGTSTNFEDFERIQIASLNSINLILNLAKTFQNCPIVLNLSSGAVYGADLSKDLPFEERNLSDLIDIKKTKYGELKYQIEELLEIGNQNSVIKVTSPRLFAFYGPFLPLNANYAIGNFMDCLFNRRDIIIRGNSNTKRSYLYIEDLVNSLIKLLVNPVSTATNIGGKKSLTMLELANHFLTFDSELKISLQGEELDSNFYFPIIQNYKEIFGEMESIDLYSGLNNWLSWLSHFKSRI